MIETLQAVPKRALLGVLHAYRWMISPLLPPACRYLPTCSQYALEAVERHGALRGGLLAAWRVLRCHPLGRSGYDPVASDQRLPTNDSLT